MGKPIGKTHFDRVDFEEFRRQVLKETQLLHAYCQDGLLSENTEESGFELELWILDQHLKPAFTNQAFIKQVNEKYLVPEIAKANIELNLPYDALHENALSHHQKALERIMKKCYYTASLNKQKLIAIGTLPTASPEDFIYQNTTEQPRYLSMNDHLQFLRNYKSVFIHLKGQENLSLAVENSTIVGAMSSFQMHFRVGLSKAKRLYNTSIALSGPLVGLCANSPFLFGKQIWEESRIAFYEQVLKTTKNFDALPRVSFGSGYLKNTFMDLFYENYTHFHPVIPQVFEENNAFFNHLRLHNGTIYRWNRPVLGIDNQNNIHFRVEFRPLSAGPSVVDMLANAAFYYGIVYYYTTIAEPIEEKLAFNKAKFNFYAAAQQGLETNLFWLEGKKVNLKWLILQILLPKAKTGLQWLEIADTDIAYYLSIIEERVQKNQTGSQWQKAFFKKHPFDHEALVQAYLEQQYAGLPVHTWRTR